MNEYRKGGYNDDLYMDSSDEDFAPQSSMQPESGRPPEKKGAGKKIVSLLLVVCLMAATSVASVSGYVWYMKNHGAAPEDGGEKVIYTIAAQEGALTPQEVFVKASPWVASITSEAQSRFGTARSTGTGIVMREDGYIITNHHVIEGATNVTVRLSGSSEDYPAMIVGSEAKTDIAVLKIAAEGLPAAEFGQSSELLVGDTAIVIGNPLGQTFADTMTIGTVSSTEREVQIQQYMMSLIQVDAAVNPGNSGGPLINNRGQVVGVVNAKIAQDDVEGIGFAIPIDTALSIANDLIEYGYVANRPMLGITVRSISEEQAYYYGYEAGVTVSEVTTGSPAELGGVKVGDKILSFNGVEITNADELNFEKEKCSIGDTAEMVVERNGEKVTLSIHLTAGTAA